MSSIFKILTIVILSFSASKLIAAPQQVTDLEEAFKSIPGISSASVGKQIFSREEVIQLEEIYFAGEYADLPIAMYKRSGGNLPNEMLIYVEFNILKNTQGLNALEFISWWARDLSRSGDNVQVRSIGLPPIVGDQKQIGNTLKFWFEAYIVTEKEDMGLVLKEIGTLASSLNSSISIYKSTFK